MEGEHLGLGLPEYDAECYLLTRDIQSQYAKNNWCNTYLSYGTSSQKVSENRGLMAYSRLIVASSTATAITSLKLLQNCEILTTVKRFTQSCYWLILWFLMIFMVLF
jgi:hypothetical protein